jgi:hypothetical protein
MSYFERRVSPRKRHDVPLTIERKIDHEKAYYCIVVQFVCASLLLSAFWASNVVYADDT